MVSSSFGESSKLRTRGNSSTHRSFCRSPYARSLRCEHLEDRRLLALLTVTTDQDVVDFNDDETSLREAIFAANIVPGADEIVFNFGQPGPKTILLEEGELEITEALTVTGPGAELLTIDAQQQSRIFNITATTGDFTFVGITLTGGKTTGDNTGTTFQDSTFSGGAVRSLTSGYVNFDNARVVGNNTSGYGARGGGIFALSAVTLTNSIVSSNSTTGHGSRGGGIWSNGGIRLTESTVSDNSTAGDLARGGGLLASSGVTLIQSTVSNNSTTGNDAGGGGIWSSGHVSLTESTLSGNSTSGDKVQTVGFSRTAGGGGIWSYGDVTLTHSTISGNSTTGAGACGGGIYTNGSVTLIQSTVSGNSTTGAGAGGGGIYCDRTGIGSNGDVTLNQSSVSGNSTAGYHARGGGIYAEIVTLIESIVSGNNTAGTIATGGGIYAYNDVTLNHSTVSGNSTTGDRAGGGGILANGHVTLSQSTLSDNLNTGNSSVGGGIFTRGTVSLTNSSLSGNSTLGSDGFGGGVYALGDVTLNQSTLTDNHADGPNSTGGGIWSSNGLLNIGGSIVANNTASAGSLDLKFGIGSPVITYSLIGSSAGTTLTEAPLGSPDANGNLIGGPLHGIIDPLLGPLADNGGPTLTHALLPGSPAINAGDPSAVAGEEGVPEFDQRGGFTRVFGGRIDVGAYEAQSLVVDTLLDENDGDYSAGDFSLREAIALANQILSARTIAFDPSLAGGTILLTMGELAITDSVEVIGLGAELLTIDAQQQSRIFHITGTRAIVSLAGLTLTGGRTSGDGITFGGGAIYSTVASLSIERSIITGNSTLGRFARGGAVLTSGYLTLKDTNISNNYTIADDADGGGFSALQATLINCTIENNRTYGSNAQGGAVFLGSNRLSLDTKGAQFLGNRTFGPGSGGGAIFSFGSVTISGSRFENNSTTGMSAGGGAINSGGGGQNLTISSSILTNNSTNGDGAAGGAVLSQGTIEIRDSILSGNETLGNGSGGGAIATSNSVLRIVGSEVSNNVVIGTNASGGGILAHGEVMIDKSHIHNNRVVGEAAEGGGLFARGNLTISNSLFSENRVVGVGARGGALYFSGYSRAPSSIINTTITGNEVTGSNSRGGGIYAGILNLRHSTVTLNRANGSGANAGGILLVNTSQSVISHTIIAGNFAGINPSNLPQFNVLLNVRNSLISVHPIEILVATSVDSVDANGNLVGTPNNPIDPLLGPLADNGGPTLTHALLPGSPAINAGDPTLMLGVNGTPEFDQRGAPFTRIAGGRIDIGAYETQPAAGTFDGDFDSDGDVDGRDFLTWQRGYGTVPATKQQGDATGNQIVDGNDLAVWQETYGTELSAIGDQFLAREEIAEFGLPATAGRLSAELGSRSRLSDVAIRTPATEVLLDRAFDDWQPPRRLRFDFGEIATQRAATPTLSVISAEVRCSLFNFEAV